MTDGCTHSQNEKYAYLKLFFTGKAMSPELNLRCLVISAIHHQIWNYIKTLMFTLHGHEFFLGLTCTCRWFLLLTWHPTCPKLYWAGGWRSVHLQSHFIHTIHVCVSVNHDILNVYMHQQALGAHNQVRVCNHAQPQTILSLTYPVMLWGSLLTLPPILPKLDVYPQWPKIATNWAHTH